MKRLLILALLSGCATSPDRIQAVHSFGPCTEADRAELSALTASQKRAARNDAIGVFLIGVPVASLSGADNEGRIAVLKGRCK